MNDSQPMILDLNGDQYMDVLYQPSDLAHFKGLTVALGTIDPDIYKFDDFFKDYVVKDQPSQCLAPSETDKISIPHSISFVDFDGDCKPDLLLTRTDELTGNPYMEIYI